MKENLLAISIVIPCYRSEKTIPDVVARITETMRLHGQDDYEVVARYPFRAKLAFAGTFSFDF